MSEIAMNYRVLHEKHFQIMYMHLFFPCSTNVIDTRYKNLRILLSNNNIVIIISSSFNQEDSFPIVVDFIIFHMFTAAESESRTWSVSNVKLLQNLDLYFGGMVHYEAYFRYFHLTEKL